MSPVFKRQYISVYRYLIVIKKAGIEFFLVGFYMQLNVV